MKRYGINEVFYSLQGEGMRAGTANVFVRFSGCNLTCNRGEHGFDCDTEFTSGQKMTAQEIFAEAVRLQGEAYRPAPKFGSRGDGWCSVIFTGGEPMLQLDDELVRIFKEDGWYVAIETNGTQPLGLTLVGDMEVQLLVRASLGAEGDQRKYRTETVRAIDWICVSPKTAEHTLRVERADELKYVRRAGQGIPKPTLKADHYMISPAFTPEGACAGGDLEHCIKLCREHPPWRLSVQQHKTWRVR